MSVDFESILKSNELLSRVFIIFLIVSLVTVPGGTLLLLEKTELFLNLELTKLIFISFITSMPLIFSGVLMLMAGFPLSNQNNSANLPDSIRLLQSVVSIYIFSLITVMFLYIAVRQDGFFFFFNKSYADNTKHLYIANYIFVIILNTLSMFITIVKVMIKERKTANQKEA